MLPIPEELLNIARKYWRADKEYDHRSENSPEAERRIALWDQALGKLDRWWAFLAELERELPGFTIGDATATPDACFRCAVYSEKKTPHPFVVVGCVSILAPLYTIYGVEYEHAGKASPAKVSLGSLPPGMSFPAEVVARRIEEAFGVSALPREISEAPIPLIVHWREPPHTTFFDAFFTSEPESLP